MIPMITKDILEEHIIEPSKDINLINSFASTLRREMGLVFRDLTSYEISLEQLLFRWVLGISSQHEVWAVYRQDKEQGRL
jgi:hypothetical protein